jgi:hypothetical protein
MVRLSGDRLPHVRVGRPHERRGTDTAFGSVKRLGRGCRNRFDTVFGDFRRKLLRNE